MGLLQHVAWHSDAEFGRGLGNVLVDQSRLARLVFGWPLISGTPNSALERQATCGQVIVASECPFYAFGHLPVRVVIQDGKPSA
ncbi:MAG: hypothetical protein H0U49_04835 [Parachlamydiaceae bacterium]|nr:hypothetical protein [Parachlamydiaceae bacterium]